MSIKAINESFRRLYESDTENSSFEDEFSDLELALRNTVDTLIDNSEFHIKQYEIAIQDTIENYFPEQSWWDVTNINIFMDLFENRDPYSTIDKILRDLRGEEEPVEETLNEARNYDNIEINDKIAKALSRKSFAKKFEKELNDLGIQIQYLDGQGTALIGPNGKRLDSSRTTIYGPTEPGFNNTHYKAYIYKTTYAQRRVERAQQNLKELEMLVNSMNISELAYRYPGVSAEEAIESLRSDFEAAKLRVEEAVNMLKQEQREHDQALSRRKEIRRQGHSGPYTGRTTIDDNVAKSPIDYVTYLTKPVSELRKAPNTYALDYGPGTPRINTYKNLRKRIDDAQSSLDSDKRWSKVLEPEELQAELDALEAEFNRKVQQVMDRQERNKKSISKSYDALDAAKKEKDDYMKSLGIGTGN